MGELKPCPFCGEEARLFIWDQGDYPGPEEQYQVGCPDHRLDYIGSAHECESAWNRRPAPQPDKALVEEIDEILHKEAGLYQHIGSSGILAVSQLLARRLAERFGGWVNVPIVRLGKLKVFQHPGEGILVNSIDVIDECRRQGVLATLDDGKSDAQIYEDHGKTVSLKVTEVR